MGMMWNIPLSANHKWLGKGSEELLGTFWENNDNFVAKRINCSILQPIPSNCGSIIFRPIHRAD